MTTSQEAALQEFEALAAQFPATAEGCYFNAQELMGLADGYNPDEVDPALIVEALQQFRCAIDAGEAR